MPTSHPNAQLIESFYRAFEKRDAEGMIACYSDDVAFSDPVFTDLRGWRAGAMWRMLCERGKDLVIRYSEVSADDDSGQAHWDADYTFSVTKRMVHNRIDASFRFRGGKIVAHRDSFSLWRWSGMALGPVGKIMGWLPPIQNKIRRQAAASLEEFIQANNLDPSQSG